MLRWKCKRGKEQKYADLHSAVWPSVREVMKTAGFHNFSTFMKGNQLYSIIEMDDFNKSWDLFQADPEIIRWHVYMNEVMNAESDEGDEVLNNESDEEDGEFFNDYEVFRFESHD